MFVDVYDGYQIIAEIWKDALTHDTEIIASSGFFSAVELVSQIWLQRER
jgi:type I restriction enzyme M protein